MSTGSAFSTGRVHPAAGAEAVAAAEHDQAGPHVVDVRLEELVLRLGERVLGDVAQDHRVVRLELRQVGRQRVAADDPRAVDPRGDQRRDLDLLLPQGLDQLGVLARASPRSAGPGPSPRAWVNPSATLLIARRSPLSWSGMNSAVNV